ncbi:glycosyltransferase [Dinghuibacter silviterrae]|uniref:Glycosyltransferase involved in cell wall biosynthesis n=1 Tax=Dinghuibacter silviterrae TaxID=1539049 RepID=A0A4R8DPN4_9BACT|nr:glycosyltransferase [Dinghuibacter silviterrae]TDX00054.1 glycosyltransferase involved in cell wall biosynthesis [Dinghuibacter silviterrae]
MQPNRKIRLALICPQKDAYSETFIRFHRTRIDAEVFLLYEGLLPRRSEEGPLLASSLPARAFRKIFSLLFPRLLNIHERKLVKFLKARKVDVVLAEFGMTGASLMGVAKKTGLPLFVHFHGLDAYKFDILRDYGARYREMFGLATRIFVVSEHMRRQLLTLGCDPERLVLNHYGPGEFFFDVVNRYRPGCFVSVGRFVEKKAPSLTIEAFGKIRERFPDAILTMVGDGPLLEQCRGRVRELQMEDHVVFAGVLSPAALLPLFEEAIAFVQHSRVAPDGDSEGTPVAVLEAGAGGLPVVATRHAGIPDVVIDGLTGFLVEEGDVEAMAIAMGALADDPSLARQMGTAARKRIREHFTLERHIQEINKYITLR